MRYLVPTGSTGSTGSGADEECAQEVGDPRAVEPQKLVYCSLVGKAAVNHEMLLGHDSFCSFLLSLNDPLYDSI